MRRTTPRIISKAEAFGTGASESCLQLAFVLPCCPPGSLSASSFHLTAAVERQGRGWLGALSFLAIEYPPVGSFFPSAFWMFHAMVSVLVFCHRQTRRQVVKI